MVQQVGEIVVETRTSADEPRPARQSWTRQRWQAWWSRTGLLDGVLLATVVGAGFLRFWGIGSQSLWYDEWLTAEAASGGPTHLYRYVTGSAGIPPTYFGFMWGWARVVGDSAAALRAFSALAGVAMVPLAYALATELRQRRAVARIAGVLVAVNPMLVWYSQEARPYTLVAFLGGLSLWALARTLNRGRRVDLAIWAFVCSLTFAVHYYAVFLLVAEALALLWLRRHQRSRLRASWRRDRRAWLRALAPVGVVAALLAPFAVTQFLKRDQHAWIENQDFGMRLRGVGTGALVGPSPPSGRYWMALAALVALSVVLLLARGRREDQRVAAVCAGLSLGTVLLVVAAKLVGVDAVIERYLIVVLVPLALAVAVGFGAGLRPRQPGARRVFPGWVVRAGAVGATCILSLGVVVTVARDPELQRAEWQAVAAAHDAAVTTDGARALVLNTQGYLGLPLQRHLDDAHQLGRDEPVLVERLDVVALQETSRPCNGLIGRSCNLFFLGGIPPVVAAHYEPAELAERAGLELDELAALVSLRAVPFDELVDLVELAAGEPVALDVLEERHPAQLAEWAGLDLDDLVELAGVEPVAADELEDRRADELVGVARLEPRDLDEWVERVELDQFAIDRYELAQPQLVTRDDLVRPRWDFEWHGLVLVTDADR